MVTAKNVLQNLIVAVFIGILLFFAISGLVGEKSAYSEREQRDLQQKPEFTGNVGEWTESFESYLVDQLPMREEMVDQVNEVAVSAGNTVVQDVYVLDTDYLFQFTYTTNQHHTNVIAGELKAFADAHDADLVYAVLPQKNMSLAPAVEDLDRTTNEMNSWRTKVALNKLDIKIIDVCQYFDNTFNISRLADFYYKSDFHWNDKGAYEAAGGVAKGLKEFGIIDTLPWVSDFDWTDFTGEKEYMGDLRKRFSDTPLPGEYIPFYEPRDKSGLHYYRSLYGGEVSRSSVIAGGLGSSTLAYNKLSTYNYGYYRVENENAYNDLRVLIIKDSYENAMTDYFTVLFKEINVVDPRSPEASADEIMKARDIDLVLCMYHESNVSEELIAYLDKYNPDHN